MDENRSSAGTIDSKIDYVLAPEDTAMCNTNCDPKEERGHTDSSEQRQLENTVACEPAILEVHNRLLSNMLANGDVPMTNATFVCHVTKQEPCKDECVKLADAADSINSFAANHCMVTRRLGSRRPSMQKSLLLDTPSTLQPTVTIDVSVCDSTLASRIESSIGISVLYFCKKCHRHNSASLTDVSRHSMTCDTTTVLPVKRKRGRPRLNCTDGHKVAVKIVGSPSVAADTGASGDVKRARMACDVDGEDSLQSKPGPGRPSRKELCISDVDNNRTRELEEQPLNDSELKERCITSSVPVKAEPQDTNAEESPVNGAEHNYATSDAGDACASDIDAGIGPASPKTEDRDSVKDEEMEDLGSLHEPRRFFCSSCPSTLLHSSTELGIHRQCHVHNDDGTVSLHCHICTSNWQTHDSHRWHVIKRHMRLAHLVDFRLACDMCDDVTTFKDHVSLNRHVQRAHKRRCRFDACKFSATSTGDLETHERCHDERDPSTFRCFVCGYRPRPNKRPWFVLHSHLVASHPGVIRALYQCRTCDRGFQEMQKLRVHASSCGSTNKLTCLVCSQKIHPKGMVSHMRSHVGRETTINTASATVIKTKEEDTCHDDGDSTEDGRDASKKIYTCSQHDCSFSGQDELTQHFVEIHWGMTKDGTTKLRMTSGGDVSEQQIKCPFCYKKFATFDRFELHAQYVHAPDKMGNSLCGMCGKKFLNGTRLRNHVREVHEGKRRTRVPPKRGPDGAQVKYHMCDKCVYSTPILLRLRNHYMSEHEGVHPYACDTCDYKTNEKSDLRRHKLKHFGLKRYLCEYCPYKTDTRWVLVKHCRSQHAVELPRRSRDTLGGHSSLRRLNKKPVRQSIIQRTALASLQQDPGLVLSAPGSAFQMLQADSPQQTYHILQMDEALPAFDDQQGHKVNVDQLQQFQFVPSTSQFEQRVFTAPDVEQELHVVTTDDTPDHDTGSPQECAVVTADGSQLAAGQQFQIVTDADGVQQIQVVMTEESDLLNPDYQVVNMPEEIQPGYDQVDNEYQLVQGIESQEVIIDGQDSALDHTEDVVIDQVVYTVGQAESESSGSRECESTLVLGVSPEEAQ